MTAYFSFLQHGDKIMGLSLSHGGHLSHGHPVNFSGMFYQVVSYTVDRVTKTLNYDAIEEQVLRRSGPRCSSRGRARTRGSGIFRG